MSYKALYREWRPRIFEDVIGQDHIVRTIKNQILQDRIPHAYLFCGTRGTGKTSTAKILSKAVNCLNPSDGNPCGECEMCKGINDGTIMDVIEIDAASNNRVENIRELIDDVKYPPHISKYKVYIIDEVHMLSTSAFNALLKTLEEPPGYVIFILATTDPQKVPPTILSRCQRFDFKRISTKDIAKCLRKICDESGVYVEEKTLELIARISDGAMRDSQSILDQCMSMSDGKIEHSEVSQMLGLVANEYLFKLVDAMIEKDLEGAVKIIDGIILNGKDVFQFIKELSVHFRNLLMVKISKKPEEMVDAGDDAISMLKEQAKKLRSEEIMRAINIVIEAENGAKFTTQPRILLEMAAVKFCKREYDTSPEIIINRLNILEEGIKSGAVAISPAAEKASEKPIKSEPEKKAVEKAEYKTPEPEGNVVSISLDEVKTSWQEVINLVKPMKRTVAAWLELGNPVDVSENKIIITFEAQNSFSKKNLENPPEHKNIVEECFTRVLKKPTKVIFKVSNGESGIDQEIERVKSVFGDNIVEVID